MCDRFHYTASIALEESACTAVYLPSAVIVDRFEVNRTCVHYGLACGFYGPTVDDLESPAWAVPAGVNLIVLDPSAAGHAEVQIPLHRRYGAAGADIRPPFLLAVPLAVLAAALAGIAARRWRERTARAKK